MTNIQSCHGASVAMTIAIGGIPHIKTQSESLIESGECFLKALSVCGQRLVDNNIRIFNAIAPFVSGDEVEVRLHPSYCPELSLPETDEETEEDPRPEVQKDIRALVVSEARPAPRKDSAWWRIIRRPKSNNGPNQKAMMFDYLFHGCVHLPEGHPQYEERKALLLRKGFHFCGKRGAWVPDPKWTPETVRAN